MKHDSIIELACSSHGTVTVLGRSVTLFSGFGWRVGDQNIATLTCPSRLKDSSSWKSAGKMSLYALGCFLNACARSSELHRFMFERASKTDKQFFEVAGFTEGGVVLTRYQSTSLAETEGVVPNWLKISFQNEKGNQSSLILNSLLRSSFHKTIVGVGAGRYPEGFNLEAAGRL